MTRSRGRFHGFITALAESNCRHPRAAPAAILAVGKDTGALFKTELRAYEDEVYLVTALVPSDTACFASSPGRMRRTAVCISRELRVPF